MTRQTSSTRHITNAATTEAYARRARELRSQAFWAGLRKLAKAVAGWKRSEAFNHRFETMPAYLLADIGISRGPAAALLSGARNDNAPAGGKAAA